jgi:predicted metal-binding membrane protein
VHHHGGAAALFAMWAAMMVAMMLPPESPGVVGLAYDRRFGAAAGFVAGYLLPWFAFSLAAAILQSRLHGAGLLDGAMALRARALGSAVLLLAGLVQLSPFKRACLDRCRAPLPDGMRPWPAGLDGLRRGALSLGSCGILMLVLFVTGVMSAFAMLALTALLVLEKTRAGYRIPLLAGAGLCAWGLWILVGG